MPCKLCIEQGKPWEGSDPICAWNETKTEDNWNCGSLNKLRLLINKAENLNLTNKDKIGIYSEYCDDDFFTAMVIDDNDDFDDDDFCLFLQWYKCRGRIERIWIFSIHHRPRYPTEKEVLSLINSYNNLLLQHAKQH